MDDASERTTALSAYRRAWPRLWQELPRLLLAFLVFGIFQIPSAFELGAFGTVLIGFYQLLVVGPLSFGVSWVFLVAARGGRVQLGDLFVPFQHAYQACIVANVLISVLMMLACVPLLGAIAYATLGASPLVAAALGTLAVLLPVFVAIRLAFVPYIVVDEACGAIEAMRRSWARTAPIFAELLFLGLLTILLAALGFLVLIVGIVVSLTWSALALATLYTDLSDSRPPGIEAGSTSP